ncbi:hypothetical protein ILUMI_14243 [Ignelater luminosus]|uniref:Acyltransferase 3 domain-containing protein n=1 Tax=Ignelater luminosus TaxID=2038154 RepID=A0A8K0G514_IGNLU|nr:hypothetical protein ILUMI_14243 [Ignelater luminosus]
MALVRPSWALAISWIILACVTGYGGPANKFLSWPIFQIISKLTYSMYLTHFAVIGVVAAQMVTPPVFTNFQMLYGFWGDFMVTLAVSTVLSLAFELPVTAIEKCLSRRSVAKVERP